MLNLKFEAANFYHLDSGTHARYGEAFQEKQRAAALKR